MQKSEYTMKYWNLVRLFVWTMPIPLLFDFWKSCLSLPGVKTEQCRVCVCVCSNISVRLPENLFCVDVSPSEKSGLQTLH